MTDFKYFDFRCLSCFDDFIYTIFYFRDWIAINCISLCITMIDVMSFWIGLMKISFEAGIIPTASIIGASILSPMIALLLLSSIVN